MAAVLFTALTAVTATGAGRAVDLGLPMPIHSMQVVHTGAPTVVVALQGSLDNVNFVTLTVWDSGVQTTNGDIVTASAFAGTSIKAYPCIRFVRANCTTLSGGTVPTVTAYIASFGS